MKKPTILKLCDRCYLAAYPNTRPRTATWGRECTQCHTPTPSMGLLWKVDL